MGRFVAATGLAPDYAVTSSAVRARTTLELAMEAGGWTCPVDVTRRLYDVGVDDVLGLVAESSDADPAVMIVGHQPTWSDVVYTLTGGSVRIAAGTLVGIDLGIESWNNTRPGIGELAFTIPPRLLTDGDLDLG